MPFSYTGQISPILRFAAQIKPKSILDVGVGMGQYGFLLRTNLENIELFDIKGSTATQRPREKWTIKIDGIEGFPEYLTPVHSYAYNSIRIGDALNILQEIASSSYDLVLAIDIIEHFDELNGIRFAQHCRRVARFAAILSTPKLFIEQVVEANPLENHRSLWTEGQLASLGFTTTVQDDNSWIVAWQATTVSSLL